MTRDRNNDSGLLTVKSVIGPLVDHRGFLAIMVGIGLVLGVLHMLLAPRVYEARATILPDQGSSSSILGRASELAFSAGITLPGNTNPSLYYRDLLFSSHMLDQVLDSVDGSGTTVLAALGFEDDPAERDKASHRLKRSLDIARDARSGVVSIRARAPDRALAETIVDNLVESLDGFLRIRRSTEGEARHAFLLGEIERAGAKLSAAEDRLMEFRTVNRVIDQSPALQREQAALNREIVFNEAVVVELRKQTEFLAITVQENLPAVMAIGPARSGIEAVYPVPVQSVVAGLLLFLFLGCMVIYIRSGILPFLHKELVQDRG